MSSPKTHLPRVVFSMPPIAREARTLVGFTRPRPTGWDTSPIVFARHPELGAQLQGVTDEKKRYRICYRYARQYRKEHAREFKQALARNKKGWMPIEKRYLETLSKHFEMPYPQKRKVMHAYVSMLPIYPRWLKEWSFNVSYLDPGRVREIACHEILHFLYFKKWLEVFPDTPYEELNSPHLVWRVSEILDPVILGEHPYFKTLFKSKPKTYTHFQKIHINGRQPATHFAIMYRRHLRSGAPFADFLREAWAFAQKHKKVLMRA